MLTLNKFHVSVSDYQILDDISLSLLPGSIANLYGPNGIGKTTILKKLASLTHIEEQQLFYNEVDITKALGEYRSFVSYVGHENALLEDRNVLENLSFWAKIYNMEEAVNAALKCFGLEKYILYPVKDLSKGWQRKVSLAKLLLSYSPVWIIDEPFANLDTSSKNNFTNVLKGKANQGGIVIIATHDKIEDKCIINYNLEDRKSV